MKGILYLALSSRTELELEYRQPDTYESSLPDETSLQDRRSVSTLVDDFLCLVQAI